MKHLIVFTTSILLCVFHLNAQTTIIHPANYKSGQKPGILADKIIRDSIRVVYCNSNSLKITSVDGLKPRYYMVVDPIAVKNAEGEYYGFSIGYTHSSKKGIPDNARVLLKTSNDDIIQAHALFGCEEESHTGSVTTPNIITGIPIVRPVTMSKVFAHIIMTENDYQKLSTSILTKIRIETTSGMIDIEVKDKKICKYLLDCYPLLKEAINKESTGFSYGF